MVMLQDGIASHTTHVVLSSAAFADFQAEVVRRQATGDAQGALRLWTSAVEVVHKPWGRLPMVRPPGLPPLRWAPCMDATCVRCLGQQGGFKFPWLGPWTRRRVLVANGISPNDAWEALAASDTKLDGILVAAYSSGLSAEDIAPTGMEVVLERSGYERGVASVGNLGVHLGWIRGRTILPELKHGAIQKPGHKGLWQVGWKTRGQPVGPCQRPASGAVAWHRSGAATVVETNAITAWGESEWIFVAGRPHRGSPPEVIWLSKQFC